MTPLARSDEIVILGVGIANLTVPDAIAVMEDWIRDPERRTRCLFIANGHTLNLAQEDPSYRDVLNRADAVFGDGTGVRWAARLNGTQIKANLNGTDLVPRFLGETAGRGHTYYLLGADRDTIDRAAASARSRFRGWELVGHQPGYIRAGEDAAVVEAINRVRPDLLLVGMGNPRQERWIHDWRSALRVPLCIGVGGLFDHWSGNLRRAPMWVRERGFEWVQILLQQPHKFRRYVVGNPKFLIRITRSALAGRRPRD